MTLKKEAVNSNSMTWREFDKELALKIKYYFDMGITIKDYKKVKAIWKKGGSVAEATSYMLLKR